MNAELSWLGASVVLYFIHLFVETLTANKQYSAGELLGPRDNLAPHHPGLARAKRATQNMTESMVMFVPVVLMAVLADRTNDLTALGAAIFFFARLVFAPLYWFGVPIARTLVWFAGVVGIIIIFLQVLPFTGAH